MARYTGSSPSNLYADFLIDINVKSQNINNNSTTLTYRLFFKSKSGGYPYSSTSYPLVLKYDNTTVVNTSTSYNVPANGEYTLSSGEFTVGHLNDGTRSISITASMGSHRGNCSLSGSMVLPAIAVKSTIKSMPSTCDTGQSINITIEKASTSFVHAVRLEIPTDYGKDSFILSNFNDNLITTTYTIPMSWLSNYMQKSSNLSTTVILTTKNGSTILGEDSRTLTILAPSTARPTINSVNFVETNTSVSPIFGANKYVQNISILELNISYSRSYEADIYTYRAKVNGVVFNSTTSTIAIGKVGISGTVDVEVTIIDNRGKTATTTKTISILEYSPPEIMLFACNRKESPSEAESRLKVKHIATTPTDENPCNIKVSQRIIGATSWTEIYSATSNVAIFDQTIFLGDSFNLYDGYELRVVANDKFNTAVATATLPSSDIAMVLDANTNCVGIGKFPTIAGRNGLDVEGEIRSDGEKVLTDSGNVFLKNNNTLLASNLDTIYDLGFYSVRNGTNFPPSSATYGSLLVLRADLTIDSSSAPKTDSVQVYFDTRNRMFMRNCIDNNSWTSWNQIGAMPITTKYSNGTLTKYPDGFMQEVVEYSMTTLECDFSSGSAGIFGGKGITVPLNGQYSSAVKAVVTCNNKGYVNSLIASTTTSSVIVRLYSPNAVPSSSLSGAKIVVFASGY